MSEESIDTNAKQGVWNSRALSVPHLSLYCLSSCIDVTNPEDTNLENPKETNAHPVSSTAFANGEQIISKQDDAKEGQSAGCVVS